MKKIFLLIFFFILISFIHIVYGGNICQYANSASATEENATHGPANWATGGPNCNIHCGNTYGDWEQSCGWIKKNWINDASINLTYNISVHAINITIRYDSHPTVDTVEAWNGTTWVTLFSGYQDETCPFVLKTGNFTKTTFGTNKLRITTLDNDWGVIDSVELCGEDAEFPKYSNFQNNASGAIGVKVNGVVNWSITLNDSIGLSHYFFAHNDSGTLTNVSNGSLSGTSQFLNKTITITKGRGNYICGQFWFNDTSNNTNQTLLTGSGACFTVNDTAPTMTSVNLNKTSGVVDTDDLNCSAVGKADMDTEDITTYHYEWYNNSIAQGIDNVMLSNTNLTSGDVWNCEAWVTDNYLNSSKYSSTNVIIGSSEVSPTIVTLNATTTETGINSTSANPTNNNTWINISVQFTDVNTNKWTSYFCTASNFATCQANVSGEILCKSESNLTDKTLSCKYNVTGYTGTNPLTFYGYVLDNMTLVSVSSTSSFEINNHPNLQTLVYPANNKYINTNYTLINWTATDPNSDTINYTLYVNSSTFGYTLFYNGTSKGFNYTNITEYETYNWRVYTKDEHNYGYHNVTLGNFTFDFTNPNMTITTPTHDSTYNTETVSLIINASDYSLNACNYTLYYKDTGTLKETNSSINCTGTSTLTTPYYTGGYKLDVFAYDLAGNVNSTQINFTTQASTAVSPGGGGGQPATQEVEPPPSKPPKKEDIKGICGNKLCERELGENPWNCFQDCSQKLFELNQIFCTPIFQCGNWKESWFINGAIVAILSSLILFMYKSGKIGRLT